MYVKYREQAFGVALGDSKVDDATGEHVVELQLHSAVQKSPREERRLRILSVPTSVLDAILYSWKDWPYIALPQWKDVPPTAKVECVNFDFSSRCFQLMLSDASFEPVPEGDVIPKLSDSWCVECVTMHRIRDEGFTKVSPDVMYMREPTAAESCPDCHGTREYRGLTGVEPCRTCCPENP